MVPTTVRGRRNRLLDLAAPIELSLASPRLTDAGRALFAALGRLAQGLAEADAEALSGEGAFEAVREGRVEADRKASPAPSFPATLFASSR